MKKRKRKYTKVIKAGSTYDMWVMLQELKVKLKKPKAEIMREALSEYAENHAND